MKGSILDTTKKALGVDPDYDVFDQELIMYINSAFAVLNQIGVGPREPFTIQDKTDDWSSFFQGDGSVLDNVRTYIYIKTRLMFDPPTTSFAIDALKKTADEYEWRLNVLAEGVRHGNDN